MKSKKHGYDGLLVVIEGTDGAGKEEVSDTIGFRAEKV